MNQSPGTGNTPSQTIVSDVKLYYMKNSETPHAFSNRILTSMDGIKIQTPSANGAYYLQYRTWNSGKSDYYPYVRSDENDYAGSPGKPIQRLQIQAYRGDGTKLTCGVVVMYRAYVDGKWLPWVSNADPEWMRSVQSKYNLDGTLDTSGSYAGIPGKNISGIEIRVYGEGSLGDFSGGETDGSMSYMIGTSWKNFTKSALASHIDGIKIKTSSDKDYYLSYRTWNEGKTDYYPAVSSIEDDYAGSPNKPIQRINIRVLNRAGVSLTSSVVVMYRVYVEDRWLPWVSNADPEWMRNMQSKYSLGGTLDTSSSYAGVDGKNISGVEIRIFEDASTDAGLGSFVGNEIPLSTRYMADSTSNWKSFTGSIRASHIDGLEIKVSNQPFYLLYKTWNEGQAYYYPAVKSDGSDYAGSPGKPIQRLNIEVYNNNGAKLTTGVVVMYRVYVDGRWLPWVSNADPEWMRSVQAQYNLGGTLDVTGYYAGVSGKNIAGIEVRAFNGGTTSLPGEDLPGAESEPSLQYMVGNSPFKSFTKKVTASHIDGIKIQTNSSKPYYFIYKTWNEGKGYYYPEVSSRGNDYAGSPNKPIQRLNIQVYQNNGTKLTSGVVVMYRVYADGRWLPWVSNADPEWMRSVQSKYNLGGTLDISGYYAGLPGKNIGGVEVRVFEENSTETVPQNPTGKHKIIDVPFITQVGKYPTGCESVSTVMALRHIGYTTSVDRFIDDCLYCTSFPFDPNVSFGRDPRATNGFGCYAPVIKNALDKVLDSRKYYAKTVLGASLETLCKEYIDNDIPVILWATMYMNPPYISSTWEYNGKTIQWVAPEHCLLLVGYDDDHYIFNDPLMHSGKTYYNKEAVEAAYLGLYSQAVVILKKLEIPEPEDSFDVEKLEKIDRETLVNTHYYGPYYNRLHTDIADAHIPENINDFNILACLQVLFLYFLEQKDYEKTDMLYDEMLILRKLHPNYKKIYKDFLNSDGDFDMGYPYHAPGRKTTKIEFLALTYFDKETIRQMHQTDDWMVFFASLVPVVGPEFSFLMAVMQDIEQNNGNGLAGIAFDETFGKYKDWSLKEICEALGKKLKILPALDVIWSFTSTAYDTAGEDRVTYVKDGVTLQDGDSYIQVSLNYDLGIEEHQFRFYFRNGYPYVTSLSHHVVRWDDGANMIVGVGKEKAKLYVEEGYVPSEKHDPRGRGWNDILEFAGYQ